VRSSFRRRSGWGSRERIGALLAIVVVAAGASGQGTGPVVPGLSAHHPLDEAAVGRLLARELRCAACHEAPSSFAPAPPGPDLDEVGDRVRPGFLRRFLSAPQVTQPGTKMPDVLGALSEAERADVVESLTHFLMARSGNGPAPASEARASSRNGEDLFHTVGCVACHGPRRPPETASETPGSAPGGVPLEHVAEKYTEASLAEFLFEPGRARPAGRMPDLGLSRDEAHDIARYLIGEAGEPEAFTPDPVRVEAGQRAFGERGCVACHALDGFVQNPRMPLVEVGEGCLAPRSARGVAYGLSEPQRAALQLALLGPTPPSTPALEIAETLTALNCIACHVRDDYGGVATALDPYFTTTEPSLGDDARIPPPLTLAGAKLDGDWMRAVILAGASVRPYLRTRMPRFSGGLVEALPERLRLADDGRVEPFPMPVLEGEQRRAALDAGRELMGSRGLSCIYCHDFNGIPSIVHRGLDLITTTTRLRPDWFARFLIAPGTYRPGVVMPESWPDGVATHRGILDGDTDAQVRAIWTYLFEGRTARLPEGLRPAPSILTVEGAPRLYRGRSSVAGFRGIAVGFPGGLSYAFDAQNGTLCALWRGEFVSVRWDGQGAGDFQPRARPVELARDVSLVRLPGATSPWPLAPVRTSEEVNPDPLYPRNHAFRFRGYSLGRDGVPTLAYASGAVEVAERSEPLPREAGRGDGAAATLRRTLTLSTPEPETLWLRVLTGDPEPVRECVFRVPGLLVSLPDLPIERRPPVDDHPGDLLLRLDLPAGETTVRIDYALLD
jgi:mono/diheme cytochrome c family protein